MTEPLVAEPYGGNLTSDAVDVATTYDSRSQRPGARRFTGDAMWITAAQIMGVVCALASLRVWSVYLTPAKLGFMALVITFASILVGIISGPVMQVLVVCFARHQSEGRERAFRGETTRFLLRCTGIVAGIVVVGILPLSWLLKLDPLPCLAIIPLFVIDSFREYERVMFSCVGRQRMVSLITALDVWTRFFFVWGMLALFGGSAEIAIAANVIGGGLALAAIMRLSRRVAYPGHAPHDAALQAEIRGEIRTIAYPLMPSAVFVNMTEMSSRYVIGATIGLNAAGLFVMGYGLVKRPYGMLRDVGALLMMPLLSRRMVDGTAAEARRMRLLWLGGIAIACLGGGLLFILLRDVIVATLMTERYAPAVRSLIPVLALGIGLFTVASVLDDILLCERRSRAVLANRTVAFAVSTALLIALSTTHGLLGAAWSLAGGGIVHLLVASLNVGRSPTRGSSRTAPDPIP